MMKRHILLGLVLAAGASFSVNAKQDDADISSKPSQLQDRAMRQEAAQRLAGLMQQSKWLSERNRERMFDMVASDETRQELQQQIAALQEQKEELDAMKVAKMAELEELESGTTAHDMKLGEISMLDQQIQLVEKKIASLVTNKGWISRETLYALVPSVLYLIKRLLTDPGVGATTSKKNKKIGFKQLCKAVLAFAVLEWALLGRNSVAGKITGGGVDLMGFISSIGEKIFGKGQLLDSFEQWAEDTFICPLNDWLNDTLAGAKTDLIIGGVALVAVVWLWHSNRKETTPSAAS
jgi:hypothetical protein